MKKIKIIIDILMFVCLITLMGYHITDNLIHEILGTTIFGLFMIHNCLNFKWYMTLFKGKHDFKRNFHIVINLLLLVFMILTIVSGVMMSKSLYTFVNFHKAALARKMHLVSNSWTLVLVSIHLGLHLTPITIKLNNKIKKSDFEYGFYILLGVFMIAGLYFFITQGMIKDMLGITMFKNFNYDENAVVFYLKYLCMALSIAFITNIVQNKLTSVKINKIKEGE